ncbi:methyltransferase small domain protein [Actinomyces sp. oral taxon 848 str. F0332]|nr:methyltransferase small domain protein [Actinomyces sp. oral taxon 848 str. F0332]
MDADAVGAPAFDGAAVPFEGADAAPLDVAATLRKDLRAYTLAAVEQLLGPEALAAVRREQRVPALARARAIAEGGRPAGVVGFEGRNAVNADDVRLANLTRLFMLGDRLGEGEIAAALPATWARGRVGAVVKDGRALFQIVPAPIPGHLQVFRSAAESGSAPESSSAPEPVSPPSLGRTPTQESVSASSLGRTPAPDCVSPPPLHRAAAADARRRDDVLIASDWGELAGAIPGPDHVMPVGGATRTLAALAAYGADERVLDVRTGCGYHAILAALCGARVTATDVSARALGYARFNAALAGAEIDFRRGSLLEPVRGPRFDLADAVDSLDSWSAARERYDVVVSNPPFVITPEAARADGVRTYRDGGREGDSLLAELVGELRGVLAPGGRAWMLGNWEIKASDAAPDRSLGSASELLSDAAPDRPFDAVPDWAHGPAAWIPDGLDAWVIQREVLAPPDYAEMWLRDGGQTPRDRGYEEAYAAWLEDFARRGVVGVGMGYISVRAPEGDTGDSNARDWETAGSNAWDWDAAGSNAEDSAKRRPWRRFEELSGPAPIDLHGYVESVWAHRDLLRAGDSALLTARLACRGVEHRLHAPGQPEPFMLKLAQAAGFAAEVQVTSAVAGVVGACDGELTLGALCDAVAQLLGEPAEDVRTEVLPAVRELVGLGILISGEPSTAQR